MGTDLGLHRRSHWRQNLDTFKDIWERNQKKGTMTAKELFRYLQGYMGTTLKGPLMTALSVFRYLQGYMGTGPSDSLELSGFGI